MKKSKTRYIIMVITEACNLNCVYCFEHAKSCRSMDFETAKKILDRELADTNWDYYEIQLMGGEPLLNFNLIKEIDKYIFEICNRKDVRVFTVTNGTLMDKEKQKWFAERKHRAICGLSIDGIREAHNRSRFNSFDQIPIDYFVKTWPDQDCRMTLHSSNIDNFAEGVEFLESKGFTIQGAFAQGIEWITEDTLHIFERELTKLVKYYLEHPEKKVIDLLNVNFAALAAPIKDKDSQSCGAGKELCSYNIDGKRYPCHSLTPVSTGDSAEMYTDKTAEDFDFHTDPHCIDCVFLPCCSTCLGINLRDRGNAGLRDLSLCELNKARFRAASQLTFLRKYIGKTGELTAEEFRELAGIARVQASSCTTLDLPKEIAFDGN